jgi:hypothetical protein
LEHAQDKYDRTRLLAAQSVRSADWLSALPKSGIGLHLPKEAVRVAVGLKIKVKR